MEIKSKLFSGCLKILSPVLAITITVAASKTIFHLLGWEPFAATLQPFFSGAMTGIIFLLGFILVGVMSDYKESEKIPGEMVSSLNIIWHETEIATRSRQSEGAKKLQEKVYNFVRLFEPEFLIKRNMMVQELVDSFVVDIAAMDKENIPTSFMMRIRQEQSNLAKYLKRVDVIRDTSFIKSGYTVIQIAVGSFFVSFLLLKIEPFGQGLFFTCLYAFLLSAVIFLIKDMDDPFEYQENMEYIDEISFKVLYDFGDRLGKKISSVPP